MPHKFSVAVQKYLLLNLLRISLQCSSLGFSESIQDGNKLAHAVQPWLKKQKENHEEPTALTGYREEKLSNLMSLLTPYLQTLRVEKE